MIAKRFNTRILILAGLVLAPIFFWFPFTFGDRAFFYDTIFRHTFPAASFFRDSIRSGFFPFWNPYLYSGVPFMANMQSALFYPPSYSRVFLEFRHALTFEIIFHTFLAGSFMYLFSREIKLSRTAAVFAAAVFAFNGFFVGHYPYPSHMPSYAWTPLVLFFMRRALSRPFLNIGLAAFSLTMQIFAGYPMFVFYLGLILLVELVHPGLLKISNDRQSGKMIAMVAATGLLGGAWSAVQLIPSALFSAESSRVLSRTYDWAVTYSLSPVELLKMMVIPLWNRIFVPTSGDPNIVGFYVGFPVIGLVLAGFWKSGGLLKPVQTSAAVIAAAGFLLAMGHYLPFYRALWAVLFPLQIFRFPAQALALSCFGIALLAGVGIEAWRPKLRIATILLAVCMVDFWMFAQKAVHTIDARFYSVKTPTVEFLGKTPAFSRVFLAPRSRQMAQNQKGADQFAATLGFHDALLPNLAVVHKLYDADGNEELRFKRYDDVANEFAGNPLSPWLDIVGVRYVLSYGALPPPFAAVAKTSLLIFENPMARSRAYVPSRVRYVSEADALVYVREKSRKDMMDEAILHEEIDEAMNNPVQTEAVIKAFGPGFYSIETDGPNPRWLVIAESFDKGWTATVKGERAAIAKANLVQMAVQVPAGSSTVELRYRPPFFNWIVVISVVSFFGFWIGYRLCR